MNLDKKLELAHGYAMQAIDTGYVCETESLVKEAWSYADAMEVEYNKRKTTGLPEALQERPPKKSGPDLINDKTA